MRLNTGLVSRYVFARHDGIGQQLGVRGASFETENLATVLEMKRLVLDYVHMIKDMLNGGGSRVAGASGRPAPAPVVEITEPGFPKVPADFIPENHTKDVLEEYFRTFMSEHYGE